MSRPVDSVPCSRPGDQMRVVPNHINRKLVNDRDNDPQVQMKCKGVYASIGKTGLRAWGDSGDPRTTELRRNPLQQPQSPSTSTRVLSRSCSFLSLRVTI